MKKLLSLLIATSTLGMINAAHAAPIVLDLTSGTSSTLNNFYAEDTYDEDGFRLQMRAGDHFDIGFIGDLGFHNGPLNPDNTLWRLTFGGNAFSLTDVVISGFENGGNQLILTGSNAAVQVLTAIGNNSVIGMGKVTWVEFNIGPDGGVEALGLNQINVDNDPVGAPEPVSLSLLGLGLAGVASQRRRKQSA